MGNRTGTRTGMGTYKGIATTAVQRSVQFICVAGISIVVESHDLE